MAEIETSPESPAPGAAAASATGGPAAHRSGLRTFWDALNEVVKSPVFVFFVGGSFIALLPRIEDWRLPKVEREAREQEQRARADAALIAPFLGNLNASEQGKFRASKAALKTLEQASRRAHEGQPSPMFEGVNAAIDAVAVQLWPQPSTPLGTPVALEVHPVEAVPIAPGYGSAEPGAAATPPQDASALPIADLAQACVYIQVARGDAPRRELATELKATLDAHAVLAPGVQLMADSVIPDRTQVRYFNDDDRAAALALAGVVKAVARVDAGIARPALHAKPGTLEVWFGKD